MKRGKQTCRILKEIRRQIAEANDIEFITSECQYQGECLGTCPKCEAEVRYLEQQLERKRMAGKAITVLGLSAGVIAMNAQTANETPAQQNLCQTRDSLITITTESDIDTISSERRDSLAMLEVSKDTIGEEEDDSLFGVITETMPEYPGGHKALLDFIRNNLRYPDTDTCVTGRVIVQFTVTKEGEVANAKIVRGVHPLFDKEALRVINLMPKWKPGMQQGKAIAVKYTVPVSFNIQ